MFYFCFNSGVAIDSPSTSDSPELISPYSPGDFSSSLSDPSSIVNISGIPSLSPCDLATSYGGCEGSQLKVEGEIIRLDYKNGGGGGIEDEDDDDLPPTLLPEFVSSYPLSPKGLLNNNNNNERKRSISPSLKKNTRPPHHHHHEHTINKKKRKISEGVGGVGGGGVEVANNNNNRTDFSKVQSHILTSIWDALKKNGTKEQLTDLSNKPEFQPFVHVQPLSNSVFTAHSYYLSSSNNNNKMNKI